MRNFVFAWILLLIMVAIFAQQNLEIDVAQVAANLLANGNIIVASLDNTSDDQLRSVIDSIKKRSPSFAALLA